jgi:hypothetical protein
MSEIQKPAREVVEAALLFGRQLEKVIDLARYVESVERLNQLADEANSRALVAAKAEDDANAKREAALKRLADAEAKTNDDAARILQDAKNTARAIKGVAEADAKSIVEAAKAEADKLAADIEQDRGVARGEVARLRAEADEVAQAIVGSKAELAAVQQQIAGARSAITKLMGVS